MKARAFHDMPVVSLAEGAQVGNIDEVLFDVADLRIAALLLQANGGQSIVPFTAIRSIGVDAVTVESTAATEGATGQTRREQLRGLGELVGLPVMNADGTNLGEVHDLEIGSDGRLTQIEVHHGGVFGLGGTSLTVAAASIRMIGPKLITVDQPTMEGGGDAPSS